VTGNWVTVVMVIWMTVNTLTLHLNKKGIEQRTLQSPSQNPVMEMFGCIADLATALTHPAPS
jgi:hypothetical protein